MTAVTSRRIFAWLFLLCVMLLGVGFYVEYVDGILPCPLCVLQRFAYGAVAVVALIAWLHRYKGGASHVYGLLSFLFAGCGVALAWRQVWLQGLPPSADAACVPGLTYLFKVFPFTKAMMIILKGTADCALVHWTLFGFTMAEWSLACFVAIALVTLWQLFCPIRSRLFR